MSNKNEFAVITSQFETCSKDMTWTSTYSTKSNYTTLKNFQETLDAHALIIVS